MRFAIHGTFGDTRLVLIGELQDQPEAGAARWRVDSGYLAAPGLRAPVLLDGITGDSLDDIRIQALLRAGVVEAPV